MLIVLRATTALHLCAGAPYPIFEKTAKSDYFQVSTKNTICYVLEFISPVTFN